MKFFILGLGSIGLRHAKNLMALGHEVCGFDIDENKQEEIPFSLMGEGAVANIICTPTVHHYEDMEDTIADGRHIFVEKPIADAPEQVGDLLVEAESENLIVMVGNMLRFHPNVMMAKSLIKQPKNAVFKVLQKNTKYKDPVLLNWGAHEIDLALHLFGPAEVTMAKGTDAKATVMLLHESGVSSEIQMDYLTEPEVRRFQITEKESFITHEVNLTLHDWNDIYLEEMKAFVGLLEGKPDPRCATGADGLATLKLISEAQRMVCVQF